MLHQTITQVSLESFTSRNRAHSHPKMAVSQSTCENQTSHGEGEGGETSEDSGGDDGDDDPSHLLIYLLHKRAKHVDETAVKTEALAQQLLHNLTGSELQRLASLIKVGTAPAENSLNTQSKWLIQQAFYIFMVASLVISILWFCIDRSPEPLALTFSTIAALLYTRI